MKYHEEQQIKLLLVQSVFLKDLKEYNYVILLGNIKDEPDCWKHKKAMYKMWTLLFHTH